MSEQNEEREMPSYNCGKHTQRNKPHWDGKHWCNGRVSE